MNKEKTGIMVAGAIIGVVSALMVVFGNPQNMGFCIACFIRDTMGALKLHGNEATSYIRPEIIGIVLGAFACAVLKKEFNPKGGSAPLTRFVIAFFVMIGCLMFLGCPFRCVIRLAGGDLNALVGLVGFFAGILVGVFFLKRGYSLKRNYKQSLMEGLAFPSIQTVLLVLLILTSTLFSQSSLIRFTREGGGPGAKHAAIIISLAAGLIVGALAQRTRMCMVGGFRDLVLFKDGKLISGFVAVFVACLVTNLILSAVVAGGGAFSQIPFDEEFFKLGFEGQSIAHTDGIWNFLGMLLTGFGCILLGGCPLRQLVLAGEGNSDSAVSVLGLAFGAAFAHNLGMASSADGPTLNGKIGVVIGILVVTVIAATNTFKKNENP